MKELTSQFISFLAQIAPAVIPIIAVYFGWKLSNYSERRKRVLEDLENRFNAFKQFKAVIDNIPRGLSSEDLEIRMQNEPELLNSLKIRLTRLLGLRRELIPYLDEDLVSFIDKRFYPLFKVETGHSDLRPDSLKSFAECCIKLVIETDAIEKKLVELYRRQFKK